MKHNFSISDGVYYLGESDFRIKNFENLFPLQHGVAYNSYLVEGDCRALIDTVDASVADAFIANLTRTLGENPLDYIVVQHMEPDHSATLKRVLALFPSAKVVMNAKSVQIFGNFCDVDVSDRLVTVNEGDEIDLGGKTLRFIFAPMVHWPEVMVTYVKEDKLLFSADAFGSFGAVAGNVTDSDVDFDCYVNEMRRYYTNIVGKYGTMVNQLINKLKDYTINTICPLHGKILQKHIDRAIQKHVAWANYTPESDGVLVAYASMYGNTKELAFAIAAEFGARGIETVVCDVSSSDVSELIAYAFKYKHIVLASVTYNAGIYPKMNYFIEDMKALALKGRAVALAENGSWAPMAAKLMRTALSDIKNFAVSDKALTVRSSVKADNLSEIASFADALLETGKTLR